MIRRKKTVIISLVFVGVLLLSIAIAYAALSSTMSISISQLTQEPLKWDIGFNPGTITCTVVTNNSGEVDCGTATVTTTTVSGINANLAATGDKCACTFEVLNKGSIAGKIESITITKPTNTECTISGSTMTCNNILYKLHYDTASSTSLVAVNDTIAPQSGSNPTTKTMVLTMEVLNTTGLTDDVFQRGFVYSIIYSQN